MKTTVTDTTFMAFVDILERGRLTKENAMDFEDVCRFLHIDADCFDAYLREKFGRSGDEIVAEYYCYS